MTPQQMAQKLADEGRREREAAELARRAERERITGRPWWDMPCRRGECPGPFNGCCGLHPYAQTPEGDQ